MWPFVLSWGMGRIWKTMLWPWWRFKGVKMNHRRPPGNTRSSLNGMRSSCTLGGRKGSEGKHQLVGEIDGSWRKGHGQQAWRLHPATTAKEQIQRQWAYAGFLWCPLGSVLFFFSPLSCLWWFLNQLPQPPVSTLCSVICLKMWRMQQLFTRVRKGSGNYEAALCSLPHKGSPTSRLGTQTAALGKGGPRVKGHLETGPGPKLRLWKNFRHILLRAGPWGMGFGLDSLLLLVFP